MPSTDRVAKKKADPDLFNMLRDDWIAAGKPAQQESAPAN
jgi:hypothetical protein